MIAERPSPGTRASDTQRVAIPGFDVIKSRRCGEMSAEIYRRGEGEATWRHPHHRLVVPLTNTDARHVTIQVEGGRTREFVWHDSLGFFPAETSARIATCAAVSLQILWHPETLSRLDPEIMSRGAADHEPLLPFHDPLIAMNGRAIATELENGTADRLFVEGLTTAIAMRLFRRFADRPAPNMAGTGGLSRERVRRVIEYIDAHVGDDLTLDEIAGVACLSPYHLSRSFKRAMGVGLHRFVVLRRIERAKQLLQRTDLPLTQIAFTVGFESQAAFTTRFRKETGLPPAQLRKRAARH